MVPEVGAEVQLLVEDIGSETILVVSWILCLFGLAIVIARKLSASGM